jgi:ABC-type amino acid transport substrate-binding protein
MRQLIALIVLSCVCVVFVQAPALGAAMKLSACVESEAVPEGHLKVAIRPAPPFIEDHPIKGLSGISIDLWLHIARTVGYDYSFVCLPHRQTIAALKTGAIDLTISPLTISAAREDAFDFSHQYFNSRLVYAGPPETVGFDFTRVLKTLWSVVKSKTVLIGASVIIAIVAILAIIGGRNVDRYMPSRLTDTSKRRSVQLHMLLLAVVNTLGIRKDIFSFGTVPLQVFILGISLIGATISASVGGIVTATFMNSTQQNEVAIPDASELSSRRISTLAGSTAAKHLQQRAAKAATPAVPANRDTPVVKGPRRASWRAALTDVAEGRADLVLGDWVQLVYLANLDAFKGKVQVGSRAVKFEPYGWGFPSGSDLRDPVNRELIRVLRSEHWPEVVRDHVGSDLLKAH